MRIALVTVALIAIPTAAAARPITSPADPALVGALTASFDGLTPTSSISLQTTIGTPPSTVTITATTTPGSEIFYGYCPTAPNGCLFSWTAAIATDAPVTIKFDQPINAIAISRSGNCYSPTQIVVTGTSGTETVAQPCAGSGPSIFGGVTGVGTITQVVLTGDSTWDDLMVVAGAGPPPGAADLRAHGTGAATVSPGTTVDYTVALDNLGPGVAHAPDAHVLLPSALALASGGTYEMWSNPDLAAASSTAAHQVAIAMPGAEQLGCGALYPAVVAVSTTQDPELRNNLALWPVRMDSAQRSAQTCAPGAFDADCDGFSGCWDSECLADPRCEITWPELGDNGPLGELWPPLILPLDAPTDDPRALAEDDPDDHHTCTLPIHGRQEPAPAYCCTSLIPVPEEVRWRDCHALDPNALEADVPTDSRGFGVAAASAPYHFTIHYENIGGADAHDVGVLLVLDDGFDDTTLTVDDGGGYDPATRTLAWIDPVVFPHDPRAVTFTVRSRAALIPGEHLRSQATIIFPDAFPPSRIDTNPLVHVVPDPSVPRIADLAVLGCDHVDGDIYRVRLTNRGFGFAFDAHATMIAPAPGVEIVDGEAGFADALDVDPATLASVPPISTTRSLDTIEVRGGGADPCEAATWQLAWIDPSGAAQTATVQAYADRDHDGVADYRAAAAGCGCASSDGAGGATGGLALIGLVLIGARRPRRPAAQRGRKWISG